MARTIRLNTADGTVSTGSGLTQAQVETIVDDKARWILAYEKVYNRNAVPAGWLPLIPASALDQNAASSYHCSLIGFGPSSGNDRLEIRFLNGTSPMSATSSWTYWSTTGTNNTTFSSGQFTPSQNSNDSTGIGDAMNHKELTWWFGRADGPGQSRNMVTLEYKHYVPAPGGYQSYGGYGYHTIVLGQTNTNVWDNIEFGFGGGAFLATNNVDPVIQVYKQLRAPAS